MKGFLNYMLGRLDSSITEFERAKDLFKTVDNKWYSTLADWSIGWVYSDRSEFELSRKYIKRSADSWIKNTPNYIQYYTAASNLNLGLLYLKEGRIDSAKKKLIEAKSVLPMVEGYNKVSQSRYDRLHGMVLLAENDVKDAIAVLEKSPFWGRYNLENNYLVIYTNLPFMKDMLGQAYYKAGELDNAIAVYERITRFNPDSEDKLFIHPRYYYRLGKLYEEKGLKDKAIERYEKFLDIWKNADKDLPDLIDAKERLANLLENN